jgi:PAS domain S-box-containing protein
MARPDQELVELRERVAELEAREIGFRRTIEILERERSLLAAVLDTAGALVVVLDTKGRIVRFNRACERTTGYSFDEVEGEPLWDFLLLPEEVEAVRAVFTELRAGQFPNQYENFWVTKEGDRRLISWSNTALLDDAGSVKYVVATGIDVTEGKKTEEALRRLSRAVEQSPSAVVITDTQGRIEYANPRFTELTGYGVDEVLGLNPRFLKSGEHAPRFYQEMWDAISAGEGWRGEFVNRKRDGEFYWELASISPIRDGQGATTHYVKVAEDISARKEMEDALRRRTLELQSRNEELDAFAHTVAHDLQNPLGLVVGFAELLEQEHGSMAAEQVSKSLHTIARNGRKMSSIIAELLLLSSVRRTDVGGAPLDMASIVREAQQRLAGMIEAEGAEIVLPDAWPVAWGHAPWVEEVWVNYLSNAIWYGGRPPRVELGAEARTDGMISFWVRDNGPGIKPEEQARLFAPFTQLGQARGEGHGLGLSIVRRIVDKLGGQVWVESDGLPGEGSVFAISLPSADGEA